MDMQEYMTRMGIKRCIVVLCFLVMIGGVCIGVIYENVKINDRLIDTFTKLANDSNKDPRSHMFKVGDNYFTAEPIENPFQRSDYINDTTEGTP